MGLTDQQDEPQSQRATMVDLHVGRRIRERRRAMGLSQMQLARIIGVTYQQAHKYERGQNRISAGRLFSVAQALAVDPAWFFEGISEHGETQEVAPRQRMCLELVRNFALIKDEKHQEAISNMARSMANS
ncbi:helix-turn-helix domain-containing protein [Belnapia sp. T18]|uniref:Helix-turn-helix domain-containing protein n=1 Tax=Belnapia arida TaxID=2804533 RepID=A0ABS1UH38_9PROT|nr:helix-turn-helix domain-containing protein [Belnapia arida]MBL6082601.1 helix-turn-helix domain-containing protein [Belnapia arida]